MGESAILGTIGNIKRSERCGKLIEIFIKGLDLAGEANAAKFEGVAALKNHGIP
jgi:hypothetical protein